MTNEDKAKRLEEIGHDLHGMDSHSPDAFLLLEAAALMRERHPDDALWELEYQRRYKRFHLCAWQGLNGKWHWTATRCDLCYRSGESDTVAAVQAAAIQWVDQQEGK